jgi:hypothetical protein
VGHFSQVPKPVNTYRNSRKITRWRTLLRARVLFMSANGTIATCAAIQKTGGHNASPKVFHDSQEDWADPRLIVVRWSKTLGASLLSIKASQPFLPLQAVPRGRCRDGRLESFAAIKQSSCGNRPELESYCPAIAQRTRRSVLYRVPSRWCAKSV